MALTKSMVKELGAHVVDEPEGVMLPTGLVKTRDGLVIPPSRYSGGTRTGALVDAIEEQRNEAPAEVQQPASMQQEPVATVSAPQRITVTFTFPELGAIPSQYESLGIGEDCLVLGMIPELSYRPPVSDAGSIKPFQVSVGDGEYAFTGLAFSDSRGERHIILLKV